MSKYYFDRDDNSIKKLQNYSSVQFFLYRTLVGNFLLEKVVVKKWFSSFFGSVFDSRVSSLAIRSFIERNNIDMSQYENITYRSFNDFFTRKIKKGRRPVDMNKSVLISPCDAKVLAHKIDDNLVLKIKGNIYSVAELVGNGKTAEEYKGGTCIVFRLYVDDYHRYCFFDSGSIISKRAIPGVLHTVSHISSGKYRIYARNSREVSLLETENFGSAVQIEVGALMVGKIVNNPHIRQFSRGQEKGYFRFGGSTIVLLLKKDAVALDKDISFYSEKDIEVRVRMGQRIGYKE